MEQASRACRSANSNRRELGSLVCWRSGFDGQGAGWWFPVGPALLVLPAWLLGQSIGCGPRSSSWRHPADFGRDTSDRSYHIDCGSGASDYVDAVMINLARSHVVTLFKPTTAMSHQSTPKGAWWPKRCYESHSRILRWLPEDRLSDTSPATPRRGMRKVGRRAEQLLRDRNAVVYCMHRFCVTKDDVKALGAKGINAVVLDGLPGAPWACRPTRYRSLDWWNLGKQFIHPGANSF